MTYWTSRDEKGDVILKYSADEARSLKAYVGSSFTEQSLFLCAYLFAPQIYLEESVPYRNISSHHGYQ